MRPATVIAVLVLAAGMAGCGGSGTSKTQNLATDRAAAQAASLQLSDFPAGWTAMPAPPNSPGVDAHLASCLGLRLSEITGDGPADFSSPDFSDATGDDVSESIGYTANAADAQHVLAAYEAPEAPQCLAASISDEQKYEVAHPDPANPLPAGISFGTPSVVAEAPVHNRYPEMDFDAVVTFTVSGQPSEVHTIIQMATKGRAVVEIQFDAAGVTMPTTGVTDFLPMVLGRLTNT